VIEGELHSIKPEGTQPHLITKSLSHLSWEWFVWGKLTCHVVSTQFIRTNRGSSRHWY